MSEKFDFTRFYKIEAQVEEEAYGVGDLPPSALDPDWLNRNKDYRLLMAIVSGIGGFLGFGFNDTGIKLLVKNGKVEFTDYVRVDVPAAHRASFATFTKNVIRELSVKGNVMTLERLRRVLLYYEDALMDSERF